MFYFNPFRSNILYLRLEYSAFNMFVLLYFIYILFCSDFFFQLSIPIHYSLFLNIYFMFYSVLLGSIPFILLLFYSFLIYLLQEFPIYADIHENLDVAAFRYILFCSAQLCSAMFCSVPFRFVPFHSFPLYSILLFLFHSILF